MTTLLVDDTFWGSLWLNVLPASEWKKPVTSPTDPAILLWMGECPTSSGGEKFTPEHAHPQHMFWSMPRRISLGEPSGPGQCLACGRESDETITTYHTRPYGPNYEGAWHHPLTPYRKQNDGETRPVLGQPGTISYRHWLGLVQSDPDEGSRPADVVHQFRSSRARKLKTGSYRLWAFGYDMDNMKPRGWKEGMMPIPRMPSEQQDRFGRSVHVLVKGADVAAKATRSQVWSGLVGEHGSSRGSLDPVTDSFWERTQDGFFERLDELSSSLGSGAEIGELRRSWHRHLVGESLNEYDERVLGARIAADEVARVSRARNKLKSRLYGPKMMKVLDFEQSPPATQPGGNP